jgi:hypothetical protein
MSAVRKRLYYFWKKLSEKQSRKKFETDNNRDDIARFKACTDKKPAARIAQEMKALQQYWGCYPYQYYRYDFFRKDCPLSLEEMKTYVPHFFIMSLYFPHSYKEYGVLCEDKLLTYATLKAYAVPQPGLLCCYDNNTASDNANNPISDASLQALIDGCTAEKLFIKPRFGLGGRGIDVFNKTGGGFVNENKAVLDAAFFKRELKEGFYIVQEGLVQHESLNHLYPHSVNTFRIMTECISGKVRVLYALVRMGSGGQQIDNASSGGLYIAFTEDGPAVIELNNAPGIGIIQDCYGGIRDDLNINPKDWWYQSNYTIKNL